MPRLGIQRSSEYINHAMIRPSTHSQFAYSDTMDSCEVSRSYTGKAARRKARRTDPANLERQRIGRIQHEAKKYNTPHITSTWKYGRGKHSVYGRKAMHPAGTHFHTYE